MWKIGISCLLGIFVAGAWAGAAQAAELASFRLLDQPKKVRIEFSFSGAVDPEVLNDFNANIISLVDPQMTFTEKQLSSDHRLPDNSGYDVLRFVRFSQDEAHGEIRVYVGWKVTPADAQVIRGERVIAVEIVKPFWLSEDTAEETAGQAGAASGFIADDNPDEVETAGAESTETESGNGEALPGGLRGMQWPEQEAAEQEAEPTETSGEERGTEQQIADPDSEAAGAEEEFHDGVEAPASAEAPPAGRYTPLPSYRNFDLDTVPVNQLEFYNQPFDKALLELVAGSGFNVVLAEGIDNMVMTLNFTQRELSLKRALEILVLAYGISYTVEDDAIVIAPR